MNHSISNEKIQYYQKVISKYTIALNKILKNGKIINDYRKYVLNWFFSLDLEDRMIICSIENKRFTNIMKKLYLYHKEDHNTKFLIKETPICLKDDESVSFFYSKKPYEESLENIFFESFINEVIFYQNESPINNYDTYNSYFTLSKKILENQNLFIDYFNKITQDEYFKFPIKTIYDTSSKISIFQFPIWISNNKNKNLGKYFTISEYFCGLFEQVISVRFILHNNLKNLNEIYSTFYLKEILDKRKIILNFLNSINEKNKYSYFQIDKLIEKMYYDKELGKFIQKVSNNDIENNSIEFYPINLSIFFNKNYSLEEIKYEVNQYFKVSNKELIEMITFMNINKLFTYDDFLIREIFLRIYNEYSKKIAEDLIEDNYYDYIINDDDYEKKNKKKKKKKKKKKENEEDKNIKFKNIIYDIIDKAFDFIIENEKNSNLILDNNNNIIDNNNNIIDNNNKKKSKKEKENKFFLFDTVKKNKKQKEETKEISHNDTIKKKSENLLFQNKFSINTKSILSLFNLLNNDITNYILEQEKLLNLLHEVKLIIYNFINTITNKVYPNSKLEIYGSSLYHLDIESSDLDLCITSNEKNLSLSLLFNELTLNYNKIYESIFPILTASVPIIKLVINPKKLNNNEINSIYNSIHSNKYYKEYIFDKNEIENIKIDIGLNSINYNQIDFIQNSLSNYPSMKNVIKILKRCLQEKNINYIYKGGMSSYVLFLLVYSFTKYNFLVNNKNISSGELLIDFLFYYVTEIDFNHTLINVNLKNPFLICNNLETIPTILDPITLKNAAKSLFKIYDVVNIFNQIYNDICLINLKIYEYKNNNENTNIIKILFDHYLSHNNR